MKGRLCDGATRRYHLKVDQLRAEGLSWREVARRMGFSVATVHRYRGALENPAAATAS